MYLYHNIDIKYGSETLLIFYLFTRRFGLVTQAVVTDRALVKKCYIKEFSVIGILSSEIN